MKFNIFNIKAHFFLLMGLLVSAGSVNFAQAKLNAEQEKALYVFMQKFVDPKVDPNKSFAKWADELIKLLQPEPAFKQFCTELEKVKNSKNINRIGLQLKKFMSQINLVPKQIIEEFKKKFGAKKDQDALRAILQQRLDAKG